MASKETETKLLEQFSQLSVDSKGKKSETPDDHISTEKTEEADEYKEISAEKLGSVLECPFTWKPSNEPPNETPEAMITKVTLKKDETEEGDNLKWRQYVITLVLSYEYSRTEDFVEAAKKIELCEQLLDENIENELFSKFPKAAEHVMLGCKIYILMELKKSSEAASVLKKMKMYEEMNETEKAAIWGIRTAVYMEYGYKGTKEAKESIQQAISFDSNHAEWHFLFGKCLGRIRRIENFSEIPCNVELKALEKAVELDESASHVIFLAESYREAASTAFHHSKKYGGNLRGFLQQMNGRALALYNIALGKNSKCSHVIIRCAKGFLKLPYQFRDVERGKYCIKQALVLAPDNVMAHQIAGFYFERYGEDIQRAKEHYEKAGKGGSYGAFMNLFELKYKTETTYNPIPDLRKLLDTFQEVPRRVETRSQIASFYWFVKGDLKAAAREVKEILEHETDISKTEVHKSSFVKMTEPINFLEVIYNELRLAMKDESLGNDDKRLFQEVISKCDQVKPELAKSSPKSRQYVQLGNPRGGNAGMGRRGRGWY